MRSLRIDQFLTKPFATIKELNYGVFLVGTYFILTFGSFQGLFPIVSSLKLPFLITFLTIIYAIILVIKREFRFKDRTTKSYFLLGIFILVYTSLSTIDTEYRIQIIKLFVGYLAQYIVIVGSIKTPKRFILLIDIWIISIVFSCFHGIYQGGLVWGNQWLNDENQLSLVVATAAPFAFVLFREYISKIKKSFYLISMIFFLAVNVVAGNTSRGGVLALVIVAILLWLNQKNRFIIFIWICIAVIGIFLSAPKNFFDQMATLEEGGEQGTAADRIYLWKVGIEMFKVHPVLGVGPSNYPQYFDSFKNSVESEEPELYSDQRNLRVAHSTPITWIAETGIFGCIILLILQFSLYKDWKQVFKIRKTVPEDTREDSLSLYLNLNHACGIAQVAFWFAALFLSVVEYPFYWCLIPFSVAWKNITTQYYVQETSSENQNQDLRFSKKLS